MAAPVTPNSYKEIVLFLATAGVVVPLFLGCMSPRAGLPRRGRAARAVRPRALGRTTPWLSWFTIDKGEEIAHLAEFGVVFLMFMIGMELSWERLRTLRRLVFGLGSLQVDRVVAWRSARSSSRSAFAPAAARLVGVALALSSTAVVMPILAEQKRLNTPAGRASFFRAAVPGSRGGSGAVHHRRSRRRAFGKLLTSLVLALGQAAIALAVLVGVGRLALRPLFQLVAARKAPSCSWPPRCSS